MSKRALIVEDDHANRAIWNRVLLDHGYEVVSAGDVGTAVTHVSDDVSLYLIDHYLPDGHGVEMIGHIRQQSPGSIVIMMSMDDDAGVIRDAMLAGGNIFIVKPSSPLVMRELLDEINAGAVTAEARQLINRNGRRNYTG